MTRHAHAEQGRPRVFLPEIVGPAKKEKFSVKCVADVAGSLEDSLFGFFAANDNLHFYVWTDLDGGGSDPAVVDATGIQVTVATGVTAVDYATALYDAAVGVTEVNDTFTVTRLGDTVTFEAKLTGPATNVADGDTPTGFTFTVLQQGQTPDLNQTGELYEMKCDEFYLYIHNGSAWRAVPHNIGVGYLL